MLHGKNKGQELVNFAHSHQPLTNLIIVASRGLLVCVCACVCVCVSHLHADASWEKQRAGTREFCSLSPTSHQPHHCCQPRSVGLCMRMRACVCVCVCCGG